MLLRKIGLRNFKRFNSFEPEFAPGINVVKGQNEAGKSTLLEGIIAALFYRPDRTSKELDKYVSWGSGGRDYTTSVEFEEGGRRYRLGKDFGRGNVRLIDLDNGIEQDVSKKVSEEVGELLGTDSNRLFLNTACIRQDQVAQVSWGRKDIGASLEEVVTTGGSEGILASRLLSKLDKKITELRKKVQSSEHEVSRASAVLDEVEKEVSGIERLRIERAEVARQLSQAEEEYQKSSELLEKNRRRREIQQSRDRLEREYRELDGLVREIEQLEGKYEDADRGLHSIEGFEDKQQVGEIAGKLRDNKTSRANIERDLEERKREMTEAEARLGQRRLLLRLSSRRGLVAALAVIAGSSVGAIFSLYSLWGLLVGIPLLAVGLWSRSVLERDRTESESLNKRIGTMEKSLRKLDAEEKRLLGQVHCSTIEEFNEKRSRFVQYLEDRERWGYQLKGMLGTRTLDEIKEERTSVARDFDGVRSRLTEDLISTELSPEKYIELEKKVEQLKQVITELDDKRRNYDAEIRAARFDWEDQNTHEEELEHLRETLLYRQHKLRVCEMTRNFISRAREDILQSATETLENESQKYLSVFTNGKYQQVRMTSNGELKFEIYSEEREDWVSPEELSKGTIDESYLACRLALVKLIYGDKKPPLILDEPFVNFDDVRLDRTLDFFRGLAKEYQIIIFTLRDAYDEIADKIILLEENE